MTPADDGLDDASDWSDAPVFGERSLVGSVTVRPSAYGVLFDDQARLAVVRTPRGLFLPGGGIEPEETPREAVVRELREECGLIVEPGRWSVRAVDVVYAPSEQSYFEKRSTFMEVHARGAPVARSEADHELLWLPPGDAMLGFAHSSHRWAVSRCR